MILKVLKVYVVCFQESSINLKNEKHELVDLFRKQNVTYIDFYRTLKEIFRSRSSFLCSMKSIIQSLIILHATVVNLCQCVSLNCVKRIDL